LVFLQRYSGEGAEAMQPAMDILLRTARALGVEQVVVSELERRVYGG
jgi:2-oxoglutarate dehydrogenase complex dehydrogenase (E1) component-like enzyme